MISLAAVVVVLMAPYLLNFSLFSLFYLFMICPVKNEIFRICWYYHVSFVVVINRFFPKPRDAAILIHISRVSQCYNE
jgi:hypothetical protein